MEPSLFGESQEPSNDLDADAPLAARLRPRTFDDVVGQVHLTAPGAAFRRAVEADQLRSIILWGPPGVGKTTLAEVIAGVTKAKFFRVSAVSAGVADLRKVIEEARTRRRMNGQKSILFIDEIHRFNKAQQDAILPVVEDGTITLIGATTENPSFEVISALLSRSRVFVLNPLSDDELRTVVHRGLQEFPEIEVEPDALNAIVNLANGDARSSLNMLEASIGAASTGRVTLSDVESAIQRRTMLYDKGGEMHFDLISALHKSVRGSDPDASLYWLVRMLEGGEDPMYLARRLVRMSVEDIGLADPHALPLAMAAQQAINLMGMPEGGLALGEVAVYLATAPKSNRLYEAYGLAQKDVTETRNDPVPLHLRNAPTRLMKEQGYGEGYKYAHAYEDAVVEQHNLPEGLDDRTYYRPSDRGYESEVGARMEAWREILARRSAGAK